jgi:hypothetical protein
MLVRKHEESALVIIGSMETLEISIELESSTSLFEEYGLK